MYEPPITNGTGETSGYRRKIVGVDDLARILGDLRGPGAAPGKTIVLCHGCFDIVHPGHIRYLEFAAEQGDILVVSITADAAIEKGCERPYIPEELRAENLAAIELVDYVVIDAHCTACPLIQALRPDVYIKGQEYATNQDPRFLAERKEVETYGGRVIFSSGDVVFSSTRLGEAVLQDKALAARRLGLVCRRHGIDRHGTARLLDRIRGRRTIVFGDTVVHRYVLCDAADIASESPMMSLNELDRKDYLGAAAMVAAQAAALGAEVSLITGLGDDAQSRWATDALTQAGVVVRPVRPRPPVALKTRFLVDDHKLLKVNRAAACPMDSVTERHVLEVLAEETAGAEAVVVYDSGYGLTTPCILQQLTGALRRKASLIAGGSSETRGNLRGLRRFDLLCTSERRLRVAMNDFGSGLSTLAYRMLQETQARQMIVTLAKGGLVTFDRRSHDPQSAAWADRLRSEYLPSFADRLADGLGRGETVLTVGALAMAAGANLMQCAYLGESAAAIEGGKLGLAPLTPDELRRWIERRSELTVASDNPANPGSFTRLRDKHAAQVV